MVAQFVTTAPHVFGSQLAELFKHRALLAATGDMQTLVADCEQTGEALRTAIAILKTIAAFVEVDE